MMEIAGVLREVPGVAEIELTTWVERGWVRPDQSGGAYVFHAIDIARVRLVRELREDMGVDEATLPLVLSLLDQVYELRGALKAVRRAIETQPDSVRAALLQALQTP